MRKGNKAKALIAVLALALALNAFGFAYASEVPQLEAEYVFEDLPEIEPVTDIETPQEEDAAVVLNAGDEVIPFAAVDDGVNVVPGAVIKYGERYFRVSGETNLVNGGGAFDAAPSNMRPNDTTSGVQDTFMGGVVNHVGNEGHQAPGCLMTTDLLVWRHRFDSDKMYVLSSWIKLDGGATLNDGQRAVAGTTDVVYGGNHSVTAVGGTTEWQQDFCIFTGNGVERFYYLQLNGIGTLYFDDFYVYEVEEIEAELNLNSHKLEYVSDGETKAVSVDNGSPIPGTGTFYHVITYGNELPEEYLLTGVLALFKNDTLVKIYTVNTKTGQGQFTDSGPVPAVGTVDIGFEIPEGDDPADYGYIALVLNRGSLFDALGRPRESTYTEDGTTHVSNPVHVGERFGAGYIGTDLAEIEGGVQLKSLENIGKDGE